MRNPLESRGARPKSMAQFRCATTTSTVRVYRTCLQVTCATAPAEEVGPLPAVGGYVLWVQVSIEGRVPKCSLGWSHSAEIRYSSDRRPSTAPGACCSSRATLRRRFPVLMPLRTRPPHFPLSVRSHDVGGDRIVLRRELRDELRLTGAGSAVRATIRRSHEPRKHYARVATLVLPRQGFTTRAPQPGAIRGLRHVRA